MKKLIILSTVVLSVLLLASLTFAANQHGNIILNRIVVIDETNPIVTSVVIENDNAWDFDDGKVVAVIPELGIRTSRKINVDADGRDSKRLFIDVPDGVEPGEYWVRFTITNEDETRIKHRLITIE